MKKFIFGMLLLSSISAFADRSTIFHPTCKVIVSEAVNFRGMGSYTNLYGPLIGYAHSLQESLVNELGYFETDSAKDAIHIKLRTSSADFYVNKGDGYSMKKATSFCYVEAESSEFDNIGYSQESRNCKRSLKAVIKDMPKCEISGL